MERKETKGRGKEATKQESKGKRRKGKDRDGKERKNERQGKGRKGQKRNGKERKWRESKGKEQKGKSRKGASERSLFVAGLAEWVGMHGLHKPFPLGGGARQRAVALCGGPRAIHSGNAFLQQAVSWQVHATRAGRGHKGPTPPRVVSPVAGPHSCRERPGKEKNLGKRKGY